MKHKKLTLLLCAVLSFGAISSAYADRVTRDMGILPTAATEFVQSHFKSDPISYIKIESKLFAASDYKVVLNSGVELKFNWEGQWKSIESELAGVPADLIPDIIGQYVAKNFPTAKIEKIKRDRRGYEVDLNNGIEIKFDREMRFVELDD